jgi:hypothetical protein
MNQFSVWMIALFTAAAITVGAPSQADAAFRLGADLKWLPYSVESVTLDGADVDASRALDSLGVGARFLLGFNILSVGLKANVLSHSFEDSDQNFTELNINATARVGVPLIGLGVFAEVGPAVSLDYGGFGYNAVLGVEYDLLSLIPLIDLNIGLAGQYAVVPVGIDGGGSRDHDSMRFFAFVGVDIAF